LIRGVGSFNGFSLSFNPFINFLIVSPRTVLVLPFNMADSFPLDMFESTEADDMDFTNLLR
jgi:hypothetical protein